MTITYGELKDRVLRILDGFEPDGLEEGGVIPDPSILDAIQAALVAILPWAPKTASTTLVSGGSTVEFDLPDDLYEIEVVVDSSTGEIYPKAELIPGNTIGESISANNNWIPFPSGKLTFSKAPGNDITLYYLAVYTKPPTTEDDDLVLEPPDFAMTGLGLYAAAMIMLTGAVSITEIRQFNTKVDSGNPEHNPMKDAANYLIKLFNSEMNRHPKHQRAQQ